MIVVPQEPDESQERAFLSAVLTACHVEMERCLIQQVRRSFLAKFESNLKVISFTKSHLLSFAYSKMLLSAQHVQMNSGPIQIRINVSLKK